MLKIIAQDAVNDVTLFQVISGFYVRYGLGQTFHVELKDAFDDFRNCQSHGITCATGINELSNEDQVA